MLWARSVARSLAFDCGVRSSGGFAVVVLQQSAQSPLAADFGKRDCFRRRHAFSLPFGNEQLVGLALVRAQAVVVIGKDRTEMVQVSFTEHDKVVKAFLADRLDEPFDESNGVRRAERGFLHAETRVLQFGVEGGAELGVAVVHHDVGAEARFLDVSYKSTCLVADPGVVGMVGGRREEHSPGLDVQEDQHEQIAKACGSERLYREEIALPKCGRMDFEEFVPRSDAAFWSGIEAASNQDSLDGVPGIEWMPSFLSAPRIRV